MVVFPAASNPSITTWTRCTCRVRFLERSDGRFFVLSTRFPNRCYWHPFRPSSLFSYRIKRFAPSPSFFPFSACISFVLLVSLSRLLPSMISSRLHLHHAPASLGSRTADRRLCGVCCPSCVVRRAPSTILTSNTLSSSVSVSLLLSEPTRLLRSPNPHTVGGTVCAGDGSTGEARDPRRMRKETGKERAWNLGMCEKRNGSRRGKGRPSSHWGEPGAGDGKRFPKGGSRT